jgi:rhamnose transport system permease protein
MKHREVRTLALLILVIVGAALRAPRFIEATSINSILLWAPLLIVVGMGQMLVIVTRGIDVSVGSMVGLSAMAAGMFMRSHSGLPLAAGVAVGVSVGAFLGVINASVIAFGRVPAIIATLGTLSAYRGLIFILSKGVQVDSNDLPDALTNWSSKGPVHFGGVTISWLLVVALAAAAATAWFILRTRTGRDVFAMGSHPEAARLRGVPVTRVTFLVYAITGALCGLGGLMYASRFGFVNPGTAGQGLELIVIAAVVIGGVNVTGGSGSVIGVVLGCLLLGSINVALSVLGIDATWQQLVYGVVILAAVVLDTLARRGSHKAAGALAS